MVTSLLLQGCNIRNKQPEPLPPRIEKDSIVSNKTITITERDTVLVSVSDSLYYDAYIECLGNKPVLRDPTQKKTDGVKSEVILKDGKLTVLVNTEAQKLFMKWKEKYTEENKERIKTVQVSYPVEIKVPVEVPIKLSFFQKLYLWLGKITFLALIGFILYKIPWRSLLKLLGL
ncbi:hypothetical protein [Chryseobacterium nakagawai]|uniref:hypothetical protein n=1 Tax=Chryseobacterium nakagawai TaxID=1241982 RepID=UPI0013DDD24E|nr:hypothetical protein [Chryseobacterium nakagawai]